ncbi:MAG: pectin acetylesterase-family hydrolase [Polyangiaceae bacterium]
MAIERCALGAIGLMVAVGLGACTDPSLPTGGGGDGGAGAAATGGGGTNSGGGGGGPTLPQGLADGWNEFDPGGDTICSRGSPYAYWVRPGTTNKVVIDFIGGGACWNAFTCGIADAIFEDSVDSVRDAVESNDPHGFYDHENADNPFKDWYHVIVPYCTGDIHWGNAVTTYNQGQADEITINHKGAVNTRAVLDWVYANFSSPEQILVTGCSAGSYGSALWSAHVMNHYPDSQVLQFGDSGAGIITPEFFNDSFPSWNAAEAFPAFIPALNPAEVDIQGKALPDLYIGIADFFPDQTMSQYDTIRDENQLFYYQAMGGGSVDEWTAAMLSSISTIEAGATNFGAFIPAGQQHCILPYDNFYTVTANGVKLTDWLRQLLGGQISSEKCQGTECDGMTP